MGRWVWWYSPRFYLWAVIACVCAFSAADATGASAAVTPVIGTPVAELPNVAPKLTAFGGYVVYSQLLADGKWSLVAWHNGSTTTLNVPARSVPFDAEAGPDGDGKPVVVFSKCAHDPPPPRSHPGSEGAGIAWWQASGCRIYELALPLGAPRLVPGIATPSRASDSTPAIWNGEIAFAQHTQGSRFARIYLWHHSTKTLTQLGAGPSSCPAASGISAVGVCSKGEHVMSTWVTGMSLDARALAHEWVMSIPDHALGAIAEPEIRLDPLGDGRQSAPSKILSTEFAMGTCGGGSPNSPSVIGGDVLYSEVIFTCEHGPNALFDRFEEYLGDGHTGGQSAPSGRGVMVALARDQGTTYWIRNILRPEYDFYGCRDGYSCEQLAREEKAHEAECEPGFAACGATVFGRHPWNCAPAEGTCTLMQTNDLKLP